MAGLPAVSNTNSQIDQRVLAEAAVWYTRLCSGTATKDDKQAWQEWLSAHETNRQAWSRIETMQSRLGAIPSGLASPALKAAARAEVDARRHVLRSVVLLAGVGSLGWLGWQQPARQQWMADLRTGIGERRDVRLPDGSQLALNTRTSVDVAYDATQRLLLLLSGEVLIETAQDAEEKTISRPFLVDTIHGRVRALGTRFLVRSDEHRTRITVLDKAVEIRPATGSQEVARLDAGSYIDIDASGFASEVSVATAGVDAWLQGSLIADNMPLMELLNELGRYRTGWIGCDPALASLKVSGSFPIDNTDRALQVLINGFPLRIEFRTRYWVRVLPA